MRTPVIEVVRGVRVERGLRTSRNQRWLILFLLQGVGEDTCGDIERPQSLHREKPTSRVQTVRVNPSLRPLGQLEGGQHVRGLGMRIRKHGYVILRLWVRKCGYIEGVQSMRLACGEHHAWLGAVRRRGREQFRDEEVREEERPNMICGHPHFKAVGRQKERPCTRRRVVD